MVRTLLLFSLIYAHSALAAPSNASMEKDCRQLAEQQGVPTDEINAYMNWCKKFEASCYKLEDLAANICAERGGAETDITAGAQATQLSMQAGKASYQKDGGAYLANCKNTKLAREDQMLKCDRLQKVCDEKHETFTQSKMPKKPVLQCPTFSPESELWSFNSKKPNICSTIRAEIARVRLMDFNESRICAGASNSVHSAAAETPKTTPDESIKMAKPDARACGIFGCQKNADGTYSPNRREFASEQQPVDPVPRAEANTEIRLNAPDARGCGLWGCQQNLDGTYSPKNAP